MAAAESEDLLNGNISYDPLNEVTHLLISWKLPQLCDVFREQEVCINAMRDLTDDDIFELVPKVGPRSIFRARLNEWRQQQIQYEHINQEKSTLNEANNALQHISPLHNQHELQPLQQQAHVESQGPQIIIESQQELYNSHYLNKNIEKNKTNTEAHEHTNNNNNIYNNNTNTINNDATDTDIKVETIEIAEEDWNDILVQIPERNIIGIIDKNGINSTHIEDSTEDDSFIDEEKNDINNATINNNNPSTRRRYKNRYRMSPRISDAVHLKANNDNLNENNLLKELRRRKFKPGDNRLDVKQILLNDKNTQKILENSNLSKTISGSERRKIVNAIIAFVIDKQISLQQDCFLFITEQIITLFPTECADLYYNNKKRRSQGILYSKYIYETHSLRKKGLWEYHLTKKKKKIYNAI